jgi:hypothetical protein
MAWSGGNFTRANPTWVSDAAALIGIEPLRHDNQDNDFTTGINECLNKTGQNQMTGNLNFGGFLPTNIGAGTAAAPALCMNNDVNTGLFSPAADQIGIATNGTEKIRVDASGRVGIGTAAPSVELDVQKNVNAGVQAAIYNSNAGSSALTAYYLGNNSAQYAAGTILLSSTHAAYAGANSLNIWNFLNAPISLGTNNTERVRITSGGALFVNTTTNFSADRMCLAFGAAENGLGIRDNNDTSGTTFAVFRNSTNGICGSVTRVTTTNAVNYNTSSDYRLKENVAPIADGLQRTLQLKPVSFDWVDSSESSEGFIAHEVAEVFPHAVSGMKDDVDENGQPKYQGVDYGKITPILAAAIKELSVKVEALEARIAVLEA